MPEWTRLWEAAADAKPFQHPAWLMSWWRHFGQPDLLAVTFRRAGLLHGLLPLYVYREVSSGERQLLLLGAGTSDYLDGIFLPSCTVADVSKALTHVSCEASWDSAHLTQLLPQSLLCHALQALDVNMVRRYASQSCSRIPAAAIADLPKKVRADVRYYRNFALGRGKLELRIADRASWSDTFHELVRLHSQRWRDAGQTGVLADPNVLGWHNEALPRMQAAGLLRLYSLHLQGEVIAVLYALVDPPWYERRTEYFYLIGFSVHHAELRPGTLITAMAGEYAALEGVKMIDMLRGEETYKRFWHVEEVPTLGFSLSRETLLGLPPSALPTA